MTSPRGWRGSHEISANKISQTKSKCHEQNARNPYLPFRLWLLKLMDDIMGRAIIVTAIPVEFEAVLSNHDLSDWRIDEHEGNIYRRGRLSGTSWELLLIRSGEGNVSAANSTERALQYFKPNVAFFVGVAGGVKDARLGDVVVAREVIYYEFIKVGNGEKAQVRPTGFHCGYNLVQIAYDEVIAKNWLKRLDKLDLDNSPRAFIGTIASGEALVGSRRSTLFKFLKDHYNQAIALEMEGYGFLQACDANRIPGLVIRGVSDRLSGKKKADEMGFQEKAASNATAFAIQILVRLDGSINRSGRMINVPNLPANFIPREPDFQKVKNVLLSKEKKTVGITGQKVGLQGMGGIGKTVLAAALAQDKDVRKNFQDGIFWLIMGREPDLVNRQLQLARELGERERLPIVDVQDGRSYLSDLLRDKACLIILDDVWDTRHIDAFNVIGSSSRMMITTRKSELLMGEFEHILNILNDDDALELLARQAGLKRDVLPIQAKDVAKECGNLPLALAMAGAMVRGKLDRWDIVLHRLKVSDLGKIKADFAGYPYPDLFRAVEASIEDLGPKEKKYYLDLAVFQEDTPIPIAVLETLWGPEGLDSFDVSDLVNLFIDRSLARSNTVGLTLHDLQHDFITAIAGDSLRLNEKLLEAYKLKCGNIWLNGPNDGYFFQHLPYHLSRAGKFNDLKTLLLSFNWMQAKLKHVDVQSLIEDYGLLGTEKELRLVQEAIRLSAHVLFEDKYQLPSQLLGRLLDNGSDSISTLMKHASNGMELPWLRPISSSLTPPGGSLIRSLHGHTGPVTAISLSPDGNHVVSGSGTWDSTVREWDLTTGQEIRALQSYISPIRAICLIADGKRAILGLKDGAIKVWDMATNQIEMTLYGHYGPVNAISLTLDGLRVVSGSSDRSLKVWDLATGQDIVILQGHLGPVKAVCLTPDGQRAVSGSKDKMLKVWDLATGQMIMTLQGHTGPVTAVCLTPDGKRAVSGSNDNTLKVWDLATGQEIMTLRGHIGQINTICITPNGERAVSGSNDKTIKIWDLVHCNINLAN
jgi:5'-methylthioadenosine/S-adenosylhomocysteine nucleosidase